MHTLRSLCGVLSVILLSTVWFPTQADAFPIRRMKRKWSKLRFFSQPCKIARVIDGDTAHVRCDGKYEKLRLVGIDTPETKHPFKPVEYYGPEASARAKALLLKGDKVWLAAARSGSKRGKYKRLLVYLFMSDGTMFNAKMVEEGYAFAMRRYPHVYMKRFVRLEGRAKAANRGMWSDRQKVKDMVAGDTAYRQHKKRCLRKRGFRGRFQWVIGDSAKRYYFTRRHRSYFRTNPYNRVLFCSVSEARRQGYKEAPQSYFGGYSKRGRRGYKSRYHSNRRRSRGALIVADPETKTFRVYPRGTYKTFDSIADAKDAGYRRAGQRTGYKRAAKHADRPRKRSRRRRRGKYVRDPKALNCPRNVTPVVGNKRSKVFRTPNQRSYKRATRSRNAVYFCTARDARQAGFRQAKR